MNSSLAFAPAQFAISRIVTTLQAASAAPTSHAPRRQTTLLPLGCMLLSFVFLAGCGGGTVPSNTGTSRKTGKLQVVVLWPPYQSSAPVAAGKTTTRQVGAHGSRFIAPNATRIVFKVTSASNPNDNQSASIVRPLSDMQSMYTFTNLAAGRWNVSAEEFDDIAPVDASMAVAQGSSATQITIPDINDGSVQQVMVAPDTTVDHIDISGSGALLYNAQDVVMASARNGADNLVPIPAGYLTFSSSDDTIASVDKTSGSVKALRYGSVNITAKVVIQDKLLQNMVPLQVNVNPVVSPPAATLAVQSTSQYSNTQIFTASVPGDNSAGVMWTIREGDAGGIIDAKGTVDEDGKYHTTYTAPSARGTFHVRATSNADKTNATFVEATVQVLGGNTSFTLN